MWNLHFLLNKPDKPIFHKNLDIFFFTYPYTHPSNMLLVNNTPHKNMFNGPYNAIFLESFDNRCGEDQYLLGSIIFYLENLHLSEYNVPTFVEHNSFGRIRCIDRDNLGLFKMLFVKWNQTCQPTFFNNVKLKLKQKIPY